MNDVPAYGGGISQLAIRNGTYGIKAGSLWRAGVWFYSIEKIVIDNCTVWDIWLENNSMSVVRDVLVNASTLVGGGNSGMMFIGASSGSTAIYNNNNSHFENLTFSGTSTTSARNIVFSCRSTATSNNDTFFSNVQVNTGTYIKSATGTTSGTTAVSVPDSTLFPVDLPVCVSTSGNGMNKWVTHFVISSSANVITLGQYAGGTPITFGTGTLPLQTFGYPHIEGLVSFNGSDRTGAHIQPFNFVGMDLEGPATTCVAIDNGTGFIQQGTYNGTGQGTQLASTYCMRNSAVEIHCANPVFLDYDGGSANGSTFFGAIYDAPGFLPIVNYNQPSGFIKNQSTGSVGGSALPRILFGGTTQTLTGVAGLFGIYPGGATFIYPGNSLGRKVGAISTATYTMDGSQAGAATYTGATNGTWTLPTLAGTAGGQANQYLGCEYSICNGSQTGGVILTLALSNGTFNRQVAKTSYTLAVGTSITVVGQTDGTNYWWQVIGNNGAV
jgi:hypothetical protein